MGCVEFAPTDSSVRMARSTTLARTSFSAYLRFKVPTQGSNASVLDFYSTSTPWNLFSNGTGTSARLYIWNDTNLYDVSGSNGYLGQWVDFAMRNVSSSTFAYYYKLASSSTWTGPNNAVGSSLDFTNFAFCYYVSDPTSVDFPVRYGKIVLWGTNQAEATIQGETASRGLVASANAWFYNDCTAASSVGTDGSGASHDFTVTGTPTDNADDPGFPAGGGGLGPPMSGGARDLLTGALPHLRMAPRGFRRRDRIYVPAGLE